MSTLTSTQVQGVVDGRFAAPADPNRVNAVHVKITAANAGQGGGSLSTADIIQAVAVPAWARILSAGITKTDSAVTNADYALGVGGSTTLFGNVSMSSTTGVFMGRYAANMGYLVSISEAAAVQFETIDINVVSTTETDTCDLHVWVTYTYEPGQRT